MSTERIAPEKGHIYTWVLNPGSLIGVLSVGRKYAHIRVTQANGASWLKKQPLPFPPAFMRVSPSAPCPDCGHRHTASGCAGAPTDSDCWAGVSPADCDCDTEATS